MTTKTDDIKLPSLPQPRIMPQAPKSKIAYGYSIDDMAAYARAAVEADRREYWDTLKLARAIVNGHRRDNPPEDSVEADRQGRVPSDEEIEAYGSGGPMSLAVALDFADNPRPYGSLAAPADTNGELYEALRVLAAEYRALLSRYGSGQPAASAEIPVYKNEDDFNQNASTAELGAWQRGWNACEAQDAASTEVDAWRERFPAHEYRPQDGCVSLKLSAPAASAEPGESEALRDMLDDARSDLEMLRNALGVPIEPHQNLLERMLDAAKVAAPVAQEPMKRWSFVETPGEFTSRLKAALDEFHDLLSAVRYVLIENPPKFAVPIVQEADESDDYKEGYGCGWNEACTWHREHGFKPPVAQEPVGEVFTMEPLDGSGDVKSHALLTKDLPAGTKLYVAPVVAQAQPSGNAGELSDEREAFVAWLSGEFPHAWPVPMAERAWDNNHVAALAWRAAQSSAQDREDTVPNRDAVDLAREGMALYQAGMAEHIICKELVRIADAARAAKEE